MSEKHRRHSGVFQCIMALEYIKCSPVTRNMINNSWIFQHMGIKYFLKIPILLIPC